MGRRMAAHGDLIRKQYLVSKSNVEKLEAIAATRGTSVTEVVRQAIDAYDPEGAAAIDAPDLMEVVASRLKEALKATRRANKRVNDAMAALDNLEGVA